MVEEGYVQEQSVYLSFRELLAVCKFFGSCAIQNSLSKTARGLRYSYHNHWLLFCLLFHVCISLMMHGTLRLRKQSWPVTVFYDLRKWCFLVALLTTDSQRVILLQGLERFDVDIHRLNKAKLLDYDPKRRGRLWHLLYHLAYTFGSNVVSYSLFYPKDKSALGLFFDLMVKTFAAQMVCSYTIVHLVFNNELHYRFRLLSTSWQHHMPTLWREPLATLPVLERLRLLHADLTRLSDQLTDCFGRFLVVNLFFVFLETLMYLYRSILLNTNVSSNVQSVLSMAINVASVPLIAASTYHLTISSKEILNQLREVRIVGLPRVCGEQVILFVRQLRRDSLAVSACGFFPIDRQLIVSMIVSMTTYFMVIIQMGPELGTLVAGLLGLE